MTSTTFFLIFIPLLAFILLAVNLIFAPHNPYQEKDSAFECGFHSFLGQNRTQFSISFFIFALLFLLFDLEILLVYPYIVSAYVNDIYGLVVMLIFFLVLTLGFAFELGKNALKIDSRQAYSTLPTRPDMLVNSPLQAQILRFKLLYFLKNTVFSMLISFIKDSVDSESCYKLIHEYGVYICIRRIIIGIYNYVFTKLFNNLHLCINLTVASAIISYNLDLFMPFIFFYCLFLILIISIFCLIYINYINVEFKKGYPLLYYVLFALSTTIICISSYYLFYGISELIWTWLGYFINMESNNGNNNMPGNGPDQGSGQDPGNNKPSGPDMGFDLSAAFRRAREEDIKNRQDLEQYNKDIVAKREAKEKEEKDLADARRDIMTEIITKRPVRFPLEQWFRDNYSINEKGEFAIPKPTHQQKGYPPTDKPRKGHST